MAARRSTNRYFIPSRALEEKLAKLESLRFLQRNKHFPSQRYCIIAAEAVNTRAAWRNRAFGGPQQAKSRIDDRAPHVGRGQPAAGGSSSALCSSRGGSAAVVKRLKRVVCARGWMWVRRGASNAIRPACTGGFGLTRRAGEATPRSSAMVRLANQP